MVTPSSLMIETNEWRSSRGVQLVPNPAACVMRRNERRTLAASSGVPTLVAKTRSLSCQALPAVSFCLACAAWCSLSALATSSGISRVRRDFSVFVSPSLRTERQT